MDLDLVHRTYWNMRHINAAEFPFGGKRYKDGKEVHQDGREQFSQNLAHRSARKDPVLPTTMWPSQQALGTQPFPESSWAHRRWSRSLTSPGEASQKQGPQQGALQFKDRDRKLPREGRSRKCVLGGKKARRAEHREREQWTLKRAVQSNHGASLTGNTQDSAWQSPELPDLRPCFKRSLAQVRSHPTWTFLQHCHYACHFKDETRDFQDLGSQFSNVLKYLCISSYVLPSKVILADFKLNICFGVPL